MKRLVVMVALLTAGVVQAQQEVIELAKQDIRSGRMGMIATAMKLTPEQQEVFWPIYRQYADEQDTLLARRISMLQGFAGNYDHMDDAAANELAQTTFEIQRSRIERRERYFKEFSEALGPVLAARFIQVDTQISTLMDFEIMRTTPLILTPQPEAPPPPVQGQ